MYFPFDLTKNGAASCLCFFGFLQSGEAVVPKMEEYEPDIHLCQGDICVGSHSNPTLLQIQIKASKTDPFRQGVTLYVGITGSDLCPVTAIISYMMVRGTKPTLHSAIRPAKPPRRVFVGCYYSVLHHGGVYLC